MSNYILATTFTLLVAVAGAQTNAVPLAADNPGQEKPSRVIVGDLQLRGTAPVLFATLVVEVGLSGGVAISNQDCSHGPEGSISIPAGTSFDTALGQVANSNVVFEGRLRDGVANLLPAGSEPALLQVRIPRFEWDRTAPVSEVISRLRNLPQVSE